MPDGKHLWFNGNEPSHGRRYYVTDLNGAKPLYEQAFGILQSLGEAEADRK
jgi:hypothetical protein